MVTARPGGDLIEAGLADLEAGVDKAFSSPEERLYSVLEKEGEDSAHSRYNALIRRLVSFERAAECARG